MPLLMRGDDSPALSVNFDPALVRLLREVKYARSSGACVRGGSSHVCSRGAHVCTCGRRRQFRALAATATPCAVRAPRACAHQIPEVPRADHA